MTEEEFAPHHSPDILVGALDGDAVDEANRTPMQLLVQDFIQQALLFQELYGRVPTWKQLVEKSTE